MRSTLPRSDGLTGAQHMENRKPAPCWLATAIALVAERQRRKHPQANPRCGRRHCPCKLVMIRAPDRWRCTGNDNVIDLEMHLARVSFCGFLACCESFAGTVEGGRG